MAKSDDTKTQNKSGRTSGTATSSANADDFSLEAESTADRQARFQDEQDARDKAEESRDEKTNAKAAKGKPEDEKPIAPGPGRAEPAPPLPSQQLEKPGLESDMALKPRFDAPYYWGSGKLKGLTALITGGDSGIGRAVAVLFAREGADVAIVYLNEHDDAEETKTHVEKEGTRCVLIPGDVRNAAFCAHAVKATLEEFGRLDVMVNNAAFQLHAKSIVDISDERFDETLRTNVYGYFQMARAAVPHMKRGASIINTGSVTGLHGSSNLLDYSTTKGAIHAFTKALASNLLKDGIRVNAVAPGPVWTPLNPADGPEEKVANFGKGTDMGRPAQPEELAPAYVFLAAPSCSSYINGIVLPVTGNVGDGA